MGGDEVVPPTVGSDDMIPPPVGGDEVVPPSMGGDEVVPPVDGDELTAVSNNLPNVNKEQVASLGDGHLLSPPVPFNQPQPSVTIVEGTAMKDQRVLPISVPEKQNISQTSPSEIVQNSSQISPSDIGESAGNHSVMDYQEGGGGEFYVWGREEEWSWEEEGDNRLPFVSIKCDKCTPQKMMSSFCRNGVNMWELTK